MDFDIRIDMRSAIAGLRVIESDSATEKKQVRFPRSKKKRIRNKWAKQDRNFVHLPSQYLLHGDTLIIHPVQAARLRRIAEENERYEKKWE